MKKYSKKQIRNSINRWKSILESMDEAEINEARGRGISDAFNTIYKDVAIQLQEEQNAEMAQWRSLFAAHQAKMDDIKRRRAEALAKFREVQAQLNNSGINTDNVEDISVKS